MAAFGSPALGILIQLVKNIIHFMFFTREPSMTGEIANFFAGVAYLIPFFIVKKPKRNKLLFSMIIGTIISMLVMIPINYYVVLALYGIDASARLTLILYTLSPFNLLKGALITTAILLIRPRIAKLFNANE